MPDDERKPPDHAQLTPDPPAETDTPTDDWPWLGIQCCSEHGWPMLNNPGAS
ncbi:hypothetical protein Actkin_03578 [Actinokineospora sp. UTMC 2448]|nr:hypothetical protein Actkin_03578 [Actinokineospora sp. UTMC 2448]